MLATLNLALAGTNLMRPYWTGLRATLRLASDGIGAALFCWLLKAGIVTEIAVRGMSPERALQIRDAVNLWLVRSFPLAVTFGLVIAAVDVYRIVRIAGKDRRFAPGVPATVI